MAATSSRRFFPSKSSNPGDEIWHGIGLCPGVALRRWMARATMTVLVIVTAFVSVGLTAPADGPFSIVVRPVFLGIEIDVKLGPLQSHFGWSALPIS
jgi:hypothetical protein